jgi:hypothetical protein
MRRAGLFGGSLLIAVFLAGTGSALAQEVQFDTKALEAPGASPAPAKRKGKKTAAPEAQQQPAQATQGAKNGPNRQFGELEGWSPGKEPPKPKDNYDSGANTPASGGKPAVSVTPSGNMNVGLPF